MLIPNSGVSQETEDWIYSKSTELGASYTLCFLPEDILDFVPTPDTEAVYQNTKPNHKLVRTGSGFIADDRNNYAFQQKQVDFKKVGNSTHQFGLPKNTHRPITLQTLPKNPRL